MKRPLLNLLLLLSLFCPSARAQDSTQQRVVGVSTAPTAGTCVANKLYKLVVSPFAIWTGGGARALCSM